MDEANPYAPPESEVGIAPGKGVWRQQKLLVMQRDAELPHRCVRCNEATLPGKQRRIFYLNIWLQLAMLVLFLVFNFLALIPILIVSAIFRKTAKLKIPMCPKHRRERLWMTLLTVSLLLASVATGVVSARLHDFQGSLFALSAILFVIAFILAFIRGQVLKARKIDRELMIFKGAQAPFLDSLPDYPGAL